MIGVTIKRSRAKAIPASVLQQALRAAVTAGGYYYKRHYLMVRFTNAAINRYGLKPRRGNRGSGRAWQGSYAQAKVLHRSNGEGSKAIGENKPFVWSGESRRSAKAGAKVKGIAPSSREGRFELTAPTPNFNRLGSSARINLNEEFSRVAPVEVASVDKVETAAYDKFLQRHLSRN